jgi:hypothetical protein
MRPWLTRNGPVTLSSESVDSAFVVGNIVDEAGVAHPIATATITAAFSGDLSDVTITARSFDEVTAAASFRGEFSESDVCPLY